MARPRKEGLSYFPLDIHFDEKVKALESLHKNDGLVWIIKFWQSAYSNNAGEVNLGGIFGVIQAENCRITTGKQAEIIGNCLEIGLITKKSTNVYTSNGIQKRLDEVIKNREFERKRKLVVSIPLENHPETGEIKEKKIKENKRFTPPTLEEVIAYCKERNNKVNPKAFIDHYQANGWMRGKNKIKDWKACVRTWELTAGFKPKEEAVDRSVPDPKQQEEVANLIKKTMENMK